MPRSRRAPQSVLPPTDTDRPLGVVVDLGAGAHSQLLRILRKRKIPVLALVTETDSLFRGRDGDTSLDGCQYLAKPLSALAVTAWVQHATGSLGLLLPGRRDSRPVPEAAPSEPAPIAPAPHAVEVPMGVATPVAQTVSAPQTPATPVARGFVSGDGGAGTGGDFCSEGDAACEIQVVEVDPPQLTATVAARVVELAGPPLPRLHTYAGTWRLVRGPAGWLMDQPQLEEQ